MKPSADKTSIAAGLSVKRPTILDVAALAGVSPATVSNALTGKRPVDKATLDRVTAMAVQVGYTPNLRARRLRTGRADTIAILSSMPFAIAGGRARMGFFMEIAAAAAVRALESGIALILVPPLESGRAMHDALHIDGALVVEPLADDPDLLPLQRRGIPVVSINRAGGPPEVPFVDLRSHDGTALLLRHLKDEGARRIALVIGAERRFSYTEAMRAYQAFAGTERIKPMVVRIPEAGGEPAARAAVTRLLSEEPDIDALLVSVDVFAVGARAAAADLGLDVPARLKIATRFDGVHARECVPPLTALDLHLDEIAIRAVELLLAQIAGEPAHHPTPAPMPTLKARASSVLQKIPAGAEP